ncbi:MAG: RNA methyltransferase [Bacteroidales bacterium]|jgi:TrmH family RNA methyltransferase|nr:RNA methyltransferase [Bacteroidales bacterium]
MLSKNKIKQYRSFHLKKTREAEGKFIVEGTKMVEELLSSSLHLHTLVATKEWLERFDKLCDRLLMVAEIVEASGAEIQAISTLQNPQQVWALVQKPSNATVFSSHGLILALDGIQDPGNMGTILRIADWFGISQVLCSPDCVEIYNPKVVQASMGAIFRMPVLHGELTGFFAACTHTNIYAADLQGENVYTADLPADSILVMGNEGNGISLEIKEHIQKKLHIPTFKHSGENSESLNVAVATAVLCSEFKRREITKTAETRL